MLCWLLTYTYAYMHGNIHAFRSDKRCGPLAPFWNLISLQSAMLQNTTRNHQTGWIDSFRFRASLSQPIRFTIKISFLQRHATAVVPSFYHLRKPTCVHKISDFFCISVIFLGGCNLRASGLANYAVGVQPICKYRSLLGKPTRHGTNACEECCMHGNSPHRASNCEAK